MTPDESPQEHLRNSLALLQRPMPSRAELAGVWDRIVRALEQLEGRPLGMANPYQENV